MKMWMRADLHARTAGMKQESSRRSRSAPTIEDVARLANVSTATVSRCLNLPHRVVESTRKRVIAAVNELGYSPNFGARAMAANRTNTIAAIIPTMENAVFARGIQAFQEELHLHGVTLLVACSSYCAKLEGEQIRTLTARGADAFLLIGHHREDWIYRFLEKQSIPALSCWTYDAENPNLSIGFDNEAAMRDLTRAVLETGHRRIGYISAHMATNDRARARYLGIRAALEEGGLDPDKLSLIETPYGIDEGAEAFNQLMEGGEKPSVVMCGNDVLAVGALRGARERGMRVPQDISITGFDDIELARVTEPNLTTVHVPHREMGREAARLLVGMVNGEQPADSVRLETTLCLRGSLAKPSDSR